jgi:hypothetical protein
MKREEGPMGGEDPPLKGDPLAGREEVPINAPSGQRSHVKGEVRRRGGGGKYLLSLSTYDIIYTPV